MGIDKIYSFLKTPESIGSRVARGGVLVFAQKPIVKTLQFIRTIIIARLLFPEDVGLFALASLAMTGVSSFLNLGINSAIIHEDDKKLKHYIDNAWTTNVLRGLLISSLLFLGADHIANFFNNNGVVILIKILAIGVFVEGLENIGMILVQKHLNVGRQFIYNITSVSSQVIFVIVFAYINSSPLALVWATVATKTLSTLISYILHPYRPRLDFNFNGSIELFKYGKWIAIGSVVSFLATRGDALVIGRILASADLSFYQMAFALGTLPSIELARSLNGVLFSMYSKFKDDLPRVESSFLKIFRIIMTLMIPATLGIFILAPDIVKFVYGDRWLPMIPILYVATVIGLLKSLEHLINPLLLGIGMPKSSNTGTIVQATIFFLVVVYLTNLFGVVGTAISLLIATIFTQLFYLTTLLRKVDFGLTDLVSRLFLPLFSSLVMIVIIYYIKSYFPISTLFGLISTIILGAVSYFMMAILLDSYTGKHLRSSYQWLKSNL